MFTELDTELLEAIMRFLRQQKAKYEGQGLVPTLDLLISDLEEIKKTYDTRKN